ncbi:MAG: DUF6701 domain-containing protein [Burkholderiales bacterium]
MASLSLLSLSEAADAAVTFRAAATGIARAPYLRCASDSTLRPTFLDSASGITTGTTLTISVPTGTALNHVMIASIGVTPSTATVTTPSGWTLVRRIDNASATSNSLLVYRKVATATEPASYSWTLGGSPAGAAGGIQTFIGVNTTTPIDVENGVATASALTHATPSVTTTVANTMLVTSHTMASSASWTVPSGMTQAFDRASLTVPNAAGQSIQGNYGFQQAAGATGTKTATASGNADRGNTHILALRPNLNSLAILAPSCTMNADNIMIASIAVTPSSTTITAPSGWTLIRRIDNTSATTNSLAVYWRLTVASEPLFYSWTLSGASFAVGGIQMFSNVHTTTPIDVENGVATASSTSHATPSVTTTVANTMLVTSHAFASSATWSEPSGMSEEFDVQGGVSGATGLSIEGNREFIAAAGATGTRTATASANADRGNTHILALKPPGNTVLTINTPAGTAQNDVMIASIGMTNDVAVITPPAGWTLLRRIDNTSDTNSLAIYTKVAVAGEPASHTWTLTNFRDAAGGIQSFSGVDSGFIIDVENGAATASALTHATPSVTTTVANAMLVTSHAFHSSATWTPPTGMTEAYDIATRTVGSSAGVAIESNYVLQAAIGATGVKTATASSQADGGNAHILALRPFIVGAFNAYETTTAAGAVSGVIKTKIAGNTISLDIIKVDATKTAIETTFTGTVTVDVLNSSDNSAALDTNACRTSWTVIQTFSISFVASDLGRKKPPATNFTVPNSYPNVRLRMTSGAAIGCSTDNFAIRPNTFASFAVSDADWQTAGTGRALNSLTFAATTHKAGRPFSVRATAQNAAGTPATTTNYTGAPTATITVCGGGTAPCTATFGTLTLNTTFAAGQLTSDVASYNNVGSFSLQLVDSTFSSVDASDGSTTTERNITSATISVGRFVPDHFAVALNTPVFGTACGSFTYIGQAFNYTTAPVITVTAQDFANNTTTLYTSSWWRITNASLTGKAYTAAAGTLNTSGITGTDPVIVDSGGGVGTLTFSSGTGLFFTRSSPTAPASPYDADISLEINVIDADGVAYESPPGTSANPARFGLATAGNGIAFNSGKPMRFGRLRLGNALGSELLDLPVPLLAEHWNGTGFVTNTLDNCTSIAAANIALSNYQGTLSATNMGASHVSIGGTFSSGVGNLKLTKPSPAATGSVDVTVDLSAAGKTFLQGNWTTTAFDQNPTARAAFGFHKGINPNTNSTNSIIYQRENF